MFVLGWLFAIMLHVRQVIVIERECSFELGVALETARRIIKADDVYKYLTENESGQDYQKCHEKVHSVLSELKSAPVAAYSGLIGFRFVMQNCGGKDGAIDYSVIANDGNYIWDNGKHFEKFKSKRYEFSDDCPKKASEDDAFLYNLVMSGERSLIQYKDLENLYTNVVLIVPVANSSGKNLFVLEITDTRFHHSYVWYDTFKFVGGVLVVVAGLFLFCKEK